MGVVMTGFLFLIGRKIFPSQKTGIFALILGVQSEGTAFSLLLLTVLFFIFYLKLPEIRKRSLFLKSTGIFLFSFLPLVFFELRHNFVLLGRLKKFLTFQNSGSLSFIEIIRNFFSSVFVIPQILSRIFLLSGEPNLTCQVMPCSFCVQERAKTPLVLVIFSLVVILSFFLKDFFSKRKNLGAKIIGFHFLSMLAGFFAYNIFFRIFL